MRKTNVSLAVAALLTLAVAAPSYATCGGGGGGGMGGFTPSSGMSSRTPRAYSVPWKLIDPGQTLGTPLTLLWFPAPGEDPKGASLASSRQLTLDAQRCVGMQLVKPNDEATIARWNVAGKLPVVLLIGENNSVMRIEASKKDGTVNVSDVENAVHDELFRRETELNTRLDEAKKQAAANEKDAAIASYQKVWEQHCVAPDQGRQAQKALRKLGVTVSDLQLRESDPIATPGMNHRMEEAMSRALAAETAEDYEQARRLYVAASKIDPADPVPLRFLGELYRHHTGQWALARETFDKLLTMQPDPLSRAVALHGLGKMTIHMGDSARGLVLFEQSIAAYPLALTYRNMAVYWNSERQREKADGYVRKALAIDPHESYNLIFAATYMADSGRAAEALQIARENEQVLSASYNLAAIYALLGDKGKAMAMLKRHFYQYERYEAVRAKEMREAQVDYVFASMKDDPAFIKLTAKAD